MTEPLVAEFFRFEGVVNKVECVFPMVILSEFRMRKCRDDDHKEDAPHFTFTLIASMDGNEGFKDLERRGCPCPD